MGVNMGPCALGASAGVGRGSRVNTLGLEHRKEQAGPCEDDGRGHAGVPAVGGSLAAELRGEPLGRVAQARCGGLARVHFAPLQGHVPCAQERHALALEEVAEAEPPGAHRRDARTEGLAREGAGVPRGGARAGERGIVKLEVEPVVLKLAEALAEVGCRVFHPHERGARVEAAQRVGRRERDTVCIGAGPRCGLRGGCIGRGRSQLGQQWPVEEAAATVERRAMRPVVRDQEVDREELVCDARGVVVPTPTQRDAVRKVGRH